MKKGKKAKRQVKRSVLIALEVIGLLFVIGLYLVDVFVFESDPTDSLGKAITVVLTLCAALYATVKGGKSWRSEVERALEDKIQGAFSNRQRSISSSSARWRIITPTIIPLLGRSWKSWKRLQKRRLKSALLSILWLFALRTPVTRAALRGAPGNT